MSLSPDESEIISKPLDLTDKEKTNSSNTISSESNEIVQGSLKEAQQLVNKQLHISTIQQLEESIKSEEPLKIFSKEASKEAEKHENIHIQDKKEEKEEKDKSPKQPRELPLETFLSQVSERNNFRRENNIKRKEQSSGDTTSIKSNCSSDLPADQEEVTEATEKIISSSPTRVEYGFVTCTPPQEFRPNTRVAIKKTFSVTGSGQKCVLSPRS